MKELQVIEYLIKDIRKHEANLKKFADAEEIARNNGDYLSDWWDGPIPKKAPIKDNLKLIRRLCKEMEKGLK